MRIQIGFGHIDDCCTRPRTPWIKIGTLIISRYGICRVLKGLRQSKE